jgi:threonine dehydrogenase-like Zn-dependent dehydrogenase
LDSTLSSLFLRISATWNDLQRSIEKLATSNQYCCPAYYQIEQSFATEAPSPPAQFVVFKLSIFTAAPVRRYLPQLIKLVLEGGINPGKVFDQVLPLDQVAEGYRAMDERRAIKTLLRP